MSESLNRPFTKEEIEAIRRAHGGDERAARDEEGILKDVWRKLRAVGRRLPFAEDVLAAYYCTIDQATPRRVKLILLGALAYFVMPADFMPDILPLLGFTDDAAVIAAAIAQVAGNITEAHRERAREALREEGLPGEEGF
jgi:uncharacterized membrane protein YkvA (DUF1232 family)